MTRKIVPFKSICIAAFLCAISSVAFAQSNYPSRPIKIVVEEPATLSLLTAELFVVAHLDGGLS